VVESRLVVGIFRDRGQARPAVAEALRRALTCRRQMPLSKMPMACTSQFTPPDRSGTPDAYCSSTALTALRCKSRVGLNEEPPFPTGRTQAIRDRGVPRVRSGFGGLQQLRQCAQYHQHRATCGTGLERAAHHPTADSADHRARVNPTDSAPGNRESHNSAGGDFNDECHR